ncbi:MAG: asparagine synthetase B, partial [Citromicrobium sp.]
FLHGLLVVEDKLSMAHSLESRVPFLDNDLVDFAMRCPVHLKLNNLAEVVRIDENEQGDKPGKFFGKTKDGKQILRDVMRSFIPLEIADAEKQGFSAPDASWFKGESIDFVRERLLERDSALYNVIDRTTVTSLVEQHLRGYKNRRLLLWSLLNLEEMLGSHA